MQVDEGGLQQLGEAGSPWLSLGRLLSLEVWGLLVLQLQLRQLQHQGLLPHGPLGRRSTLREGPQVGYGEAKPEDGVGGEEGEGGAQLTALGLRGETGRYLVFIYQYWLNMDFKIRFGYTVRDLLTAEMLQ